MADRGPTIGASIVDVGAFYREHVAPKLDGRVTANVERLLHETLRDILRTTDPNSVEHGDPTATVFTLASRVKAEALSQLGHGGDLCEIRFLLELSHEIGRVGGPDTGYLKQLSTSGLLRLARAAWRNNDHLWEIQIREELGMRVADAETTLDNLQKLARLYYLTGQDNKERLAKIAILRYLDGIDSQSEVQAAEGVIGRMPPGTRCALRKLAIDKHLLRAEIVLRRTALEIGIDPRTNFMNGYYLGFALKKVSKAEEALVVLESFLKHVESLRAEGTTPQDMNLEDDFDHWVFRAKNLIFECHHDMGTLDEAALNEALEFFEANSHVYPLRAHEKLATIHEMRGEFEDALSHLQDLLAMLEESVDERADIEAARVRRMISELERKMDAAEEAGS